VTGVPKLFHQMWLRNSPGPIPATYRKWTEEWKDTHKDWTYRLWTSIPPLTPPSLDLWQRAAEISPDTVEQFRSDIARYEILYQYGGVWVDIDCQPQKPIDPLCDVEAFVAWEVQDRWASNAIMGAVPGHPFIKELIERLPGSVRRHHNKANTKKSGPQFLTPILRRHPEVRVYHQHMFFPYAYNELDRAAEDFPDAYAVHHFANQRRKKGVPL